MKAHFIPVNLQWIATIISCVNVIFKDTPWAGWSLLEHGGHMKTMWAECTGFLMRSRDGLMWRRKNCFVTLFQSVFSERIWPICKVRETSAKRLEQNIWRVLRSCFNSHFSMGLIWGVLQLMGRREFGSWCPDTDTTLKSAFVVLSMRYQWHQMKTFTNFSCTRNSLSFHLSNTVAFEK